MSHGGEPQRSSSGVLVQTDGDLEDPTRFDYIAVCGGNDYLNTRLPRGLLDYLRQAAASRVRLLGICTGTFALARADLVGERRVCVHWNVLDAFTAQFPRSNAVVDSLFIDEGDLITCAGSTAAIDLGLYLVARHCGADKAHQALRHMMLQDVRPPAMPQAHFYARLGSDIDIRVRQAALFIEQRLDSPPSVQAVARYVGVSERQLDRLFHKAFGIGPAGFHRRMRLDYAAWLLTHTRRSITRVALDAGFADAAHLSRDFRSSRGTTPSHHRASSTPPASTGER